MDSEYINIELFVEFGIAKEIEGFSKYFVLKDGRIWSSKRNMFLAQRKDSLGKYLICDIGKKKTKKTKLVHRLVAMSFVQNLENKPEVNHINGIKTDNRSDNLEWVTRSENLIHSYLYLNRVSPMKNMCGSNNPKSKDVFQYDRDMNLLSTYESSCIASKETGTQQSDISRACNGKLKTANNFIWRYTKI